MKRRGKVLAVISSKGGSGKTVTAANLAAALSSYFDKKILVIDANITTACLGMHFGILYPKVTIYDVLKKNFQLENAFFPYNSNLYIVPASMTIEKNYYDDPSLLQDTMGELINHYHILLSYVTNEFDLVILDAAPGFSVEAITTMKVADGNLIVTNPEYPAIAATIKLVEYARMIKTPLAGIVLNRVMKKSYEPKKEDLEKLFRVKIVGEIPYDKNVPEAIANKTPIVLYNESSPASIAYKKLAATLIGKEYKADFLERMRNLLNF